MSCRKYGQKIFVSKEKPEWNESITISICGRKRFYHEGFSDLVTQYYILHKHIEDLVR